MIGVVDVNFGNLGKLKACLRALGCEYRPVSTVDEVVEAPSLILPGVGSFGDYIQNLEANRLLGPIRQHSYQGKPLLGICAGAQVLCATSEESPGIRGLGIFNAKVKKLIPIVKRDKVPSVGLRHCRGKGTCEAGDFGDGNFYFVHSYHIEISRQQCSYISNYELSCGTLVCASYARDKNYGIQFHPELSGQVGLDCLKKVFKAW